MARPIPCDNGDGQPGAYVITNLDDGSTFAVCVGCWVQLCATVAVSAGAIAPDAPATAPGPVDLPDDDPSNPDQDVQTVDALPGSIEALDLAHQSGDPAVIAAAEAQHDRVHAELAARPDSAPTSESVTWAPDQTEVSRD